MMMVCNERMIPRRMTRSTLTLSCNQHQHVRYTPKKRKGRNVDQSAPIQVNTPASFSRIPSDSECREPTGPYPTETSSPSIDVNVVDSLPTETIAPSSPSTDVNIIAVDSLPTETSSPSTDVNIIVVDSLQNDLTELCVVLRPLAWTGEREDLTKHRIEVNSRVVQFIYTESKYLKNLQS